jgi:type II secretory ATPase GspE/PulE/Tfp pilus assembly ATPase PilB-like protein
LYRLTISSGTSSGNAPLAELRGAAESKGMGTLRGHGLQKVYDGATNIEEIVRVTQV